MKTPSVLPSPPESTRLVPARARRWLAGLVVAALAIGGPALVASPALAEEIATATATNEPQLDAGTDVASDRAADAAAAADAPDAPTSNETDPGETEEHPAESSAEPSTDSAASSTQAAPPASARVPAPVAPAADGIAPAAVPTVTVTPAPRGGGAVTVEGSGFAATSPGVYLGLGPAGLAGFYEGSGSLVSTETVWIAVGNADGESGAGKTAPMGSDGAFRVTVTVPALSGDARYAVYTSKAHGQGFADRSQNTIIPLEWQAPPAPKPTVTVSKTSGLDRAGEVVRVTGSGFAANPPATNGTRPPLAGTFGGAYVVFGKFADAWRPSEGVASSARKVIAQKWGVAAADFGGAVNAGNGGFVIGADGSFEVELTVAASEANELLAGNYGVYTYPGSGAAYAAFETATPITFAEPQPSGPVLSVTPAADVDSTVANTFTVSGTGYSGPGAASGAYVLIGEESVWDGSGPLPSAGWLAQGWVRAAQLQNGAFTTTVTVPAGAFDPAKRYVVATSAAHALSVTDRSLDAFAPIGIAPLPPSPTLTVTPAEQVDSTIENVFTISGTGYVGPGAASGAYVLIGEASVWDGSGPLPSDGWLAQAWVTAAQIRDGAFTTTITVPAGRFDPEAAYVVASSAAHRLSATDRSLDAFAAISIAPATSEPGGPTDPTDPPVVVPPVVTPPVIRSGSLSWGVHAGFTEYITGAIAKGRIAVQAGATSADGVFRFGQTGGSFSPVTGLGSAEYAGTVRFTGHGGLLDVSLSNPALRVDSPTQGVLEVTANGARVDFATVDLGGASRSVSDGATVFSGAPAILTAAGATAFAGYYGAGERLAPVTAVIGTPGAAPAGSTGTVASAATASTTRTVPPAPPATTGIDLDAPTLERLVRGEVVTISVGGFEPFEEDVMVVVYSTPTVLARDLVADASGVVTWTGSLPATLEPGQHTLTFQGSVSRGIVITVPALAVSACRVAGATLDWGFKQSFLAYLEGGIANGGWETADGATESGAVFSWTPGAGDLSADGTTGVVHFTGSVRFSGHDGALDTTIANPKVELTAGGAYLLLDVTGRTQGGEAIDARGVRFAELDLESAGLRSTDGTLTATEVPATLTEEGAAAFGTYPAGEALDPADFTLPLAAECDTAGVELEVDDTSKGAGEASAATEAAAAEPVDLAWLWWGGAIVLLVGAGAVVLVLARRRAAKVE